ncbi:carboxymuconolactone decarboxylase family protein [Kribbella qitaiheensis]|uniref:Carboxymuconolactone decarboxylase family protein n=1 Tax=Kribbella qitaiheensis TaxID=1544730 RepID=A0A7G6WRS9_9ACTN|nr:carboxymuconolactone decarboxylase family protein [Kribbella qitaiheensis]QNE16694.1 carboxymuconolactone decarboxylase family protein [Kribbella qitaiheensis]
MPSRLHPVEPPYSDAVKRLLTKLMPPDSGYEPLLLFRILALNTDLASRAHPMASGLLVKGSLPARDRELLISRTTARAGAEYEWGVHAVVFAEAVGLDRDLVDKLALGPLDAAFDGPDLLLVTAADELHDRATLSDETWSSLRVRYDDAQLIELILLVGWYRTLSTLINAVELPLEAWAARFPG